MKVAKFLALSRQRLVTCLPDDHLSAVANLIFAHNIGAMPVCEQGIRMVGIISERDLVRAFARSDWSELQHIRARDLMTTRVITCGPDDSMLTAQRLMKENHIRHVPVLRDGQVQGMISLRDALSHRLQQSEQESSVLRDIARADIAFGSG